MSKILKNTTNSDIVLVNLGRTIESNSSLTIEPSDYLNLSSTLSLNEITSLIIDGHIIVNDGINDLESSQGIEYIKYSNFANSIRFSSEPERSNGLSSKTLQNAIEELQETLLATTSLVYTETATNLVTRTANTFTVIPGMSITPPAGKYLVIFNGSVGTTGVNTEGEITIGLASSVQPDATRLIRNTAGILGLVTLSTNSSNGAYTSSIVVDVDGTQAIVAAFRHISGGSITVTNRTLTLVRVFSQGEIVASLPITTNLHSSLGGLLADDHPQYLRVDGLRALTGNLDLNNNNIVRSGLINGISLESHASRHLPLGQDPLTTGTPVSTSVQNTTGIANSFSRSDHTHNTVLERFSINTTGEVQTNSTNDVLLNGMTLIPPTGNYVYFAGSTFNHFDSTRNVFFSLYKNSTQIPGTLDEFTTGNNNQAREVRQTWSTVGIVTLNGSESLNIRWRSNSGTVRSFSRFLTLIRVG